MQDMPVTTIFTSPPKKHNSQAVREKKTIIESG